MPEGEPPTTCILLSCLPAGLPFAPRKEAAEIGVHLEHGLSSLAATVLLPFVHPGNQLSSYTGSPQMTLLQIHGCLYLGEAPPTFVFKLHSCDCVRS